MESTRRGIHTIKSRKTGKTYEVCKMRTEDSFFLSVYHYRQSEISEWRSLHVDTLAECRRELNA